MHLQEQSVDGIIDSLTKLVSGGAKFTTNLATQVIQGKQAYDATKAAWKGAQYLAPVNLQTGIPYAAAGGTGDRFMPGTTQIAAPAAERPLSKAEIAELQKTLNAMGYNTGAVDGVFGPNTSAGIRAFQTAYNLSPSGQLSVALLQTVRNISTQSAVSTQPQTAHTPPASQLPPYYAGPADSTPTAASLKTTEDASLKTMEEKLWTWVIPGVAALGSLLLIMMQNKGRR